MALNVGHWESIGPTRITEGLGATGRIHSVAIDPISPSTIYIGARSGQAGFPKFGGCGVWKTTNGGSSWRPVTDNLPSLMLAAIAIDPSAHTRIHIALLSHEEKDSSSTLKGAGFFRSEDGGASWASVSTDDRLNGSILLVDPANSDVLYMSANDGVYRSTDRGVTWNPVLAMSGGSITDLIMDPANSNQLYAAMRHNSSNATAGIYQSTDGGSSWTKISGSGLPTVTMNTTIRLALSDTRLYASFRGSVWTLYRRVDSSWTQLWSFSNYLRPA